MTVALIDYNVSKWTNNLLETQKGEEPSFSVHFHEAHWSINNSATSQFLYGSAISSILDDIRACRIPTDFLDLFDKTGVRFFEGCLIVALYDHRIRVRTNGSNNTADTGPDPQRVVLQPTPETLYADIKSLAEADRIQGRLWTDEQALEFESEILLATSQPLCLDPDINVTRIANRLLRASTPTVPRSLKRKRGEGPDESGDDEFQKAQRAKLMQFMNPRSGRTFNPRLADGRIDFALVRDVLAQMAGKPPGGSAPPQAPRQSTPLPINAGVPRAASLSSAKGSISGKLEDKKKPNLNVVMMKKGLGGKGVDDSPASTSTSLPSASEDRPKVILKLPTQASIKKDESAQRVSTPIPGPVPGRVSTPLQQPVRTQTPVPSQAGPMNPTQSNAAHAAPPPPQTSGLSFQPGQLPEQFLRGLPPPKNAAAGSNMPQAAAGKRPQTPQAAAMMMATAAKGTVPSQAGGPPTMLGPNGVPMYQTQANAQQAFNLMAAAHARAATVNAAAGRGMPMTSNRFSGALQMARPAAPGVVAMPPNPLASGSGDNANPGSNARPGAQPQPGTIPPNWHAQMHAIQMQQQQGQRPMNMQMYQWMNAMAMGRGMPIGRGQLNPLQIQQMQALQAQLHAQQQQHQQQQRPGAAPPGVPKPPGAR